jgi:hypothetical protein
MTYSTDGGTTFTEKYGEVTISREDQPHSIVVPLDDLEEFFEDYFGDGEGGGNGDSESNATKNS